MNIITQQTPSPWPARARYAILFILAAALALLAFGVYTGQPVFFLKWFFGLQADD